MTSRIRFTSYPKTQPPNGFILPVVAAFQSNEAKIGTENNKKGLTSDEVLQVLAGELEAAGWKVEKGKLRSQKIDRPVFYGENGKPALNYQIDAYHPLYRCGLEVEAGRGWMGNAVYRDLVQALVMVEVDHLILAVSNQYVYKNKGKSISSADYENTIEVADALYGHNRLKLPYGLTVIGY